jgi:predicted aspartyl protease
MRTHPCWKWITGALLWSGPLSAAPPPAATAGGLGQYLAQNGYVPVPVDNTDGNQGLVQVRINGGMGTLALDTGSIRTCLTNGFARHLKLDLRQADPMVGVGGSVAGSGVALLNSFTLNNLAINRTNTIQVLPARASAPADGLLGYDYMHLNSMILPVGANFLLYKKGTAPLPEIDSSLKAYGYQPIPLSVGEGGLRAAGSLDGHPLVALVDSGAKYTVFDLGFVKMTVGALVSTSRMIFWGIDGRPMYVGTFDADKLTLGAMTFRPITTTTANARTLQTLHVQALLGYDLLAQHQAIIDLGHDVLWMR